MGSANTQATRSTLQSVDTTLSENITATQNYIPVASTTNFSTSVVAEIESTNEVVSFTDISENRIGNSSTWSGAGWQSPLRQTLTSNAGTAPDGTNTAFSLVPDSSNNTHRQDIAPVINGGMLNSTTYAISIFAKANGYTGLSFGLCATSNVGAGNTPKTVYFNLATGTVSFTGSSITSSSIEDFGDGWYRCKIVGTTPASYDVSNPDRLLFGIGEDESTFSYVGNTTDGILLWGPQIEQKSTHSTYIPNDNVNPVYGLTNVTRGVNGTTAQAASSGDSIQQLPYALGSLDMPVRLRAISVSPDGTGNARLTLCDSNGDTLCDVDIPNAKSYTLNMPEDGIIFPNGVFVSNTDNITAYTVYTEKYSGPNLTTNNPG